MTDSSSKIIITGAAGFIGSCMVDYLNNIGYYNLVLVDRFNLVSKRSSWAINKYFELIDFDDLFDWLKESNIAIDGVIHLGAHTDTLGANYSIYEKLNVQYSKSVWNYCSGNQIPLIYASSASTYGSGEFGYDDNHEIIEFLKPLNSYGVSKNEFDKWALKQPKTPSYWAGLKFFNVYGANEGHKERMASVIWHSYNQIIDNNLVKLFKSYNNEYKDGEQLRDFVYVKDVLKIVSWMLSLMLNNEWKSSNNGLYNIGTSDARSFYNLACIIFKTLNKEPQIVYVDMPVEIKNKYQYFTRANISKLRAIGYEDRFYSLEEGIDDYINNYLTADC